MPSETLFLDSAFAIALAAPDDECHEQAGKLALEIESQGWQMVTTDAVVLEIGDALSKPKFRTAAVQLITSLFTDANIEVVSLHSSLMRRAFDLFRKRSDKGWGMTDCVSFIVMEDRKITRALTTDEHFEQAGFVALLKN